MAEQIQRGDHIEAQDAHGRWLPAVAMSVLEGTHALDPETHRQHKVHDFPVIWVKVEGTADPVPWPATHVRRPQPDSEEG